MDEDLNNLASPLASDYPESDFSVEWDNISILHFVPLILYTKYLKHWLE